MNTILSRLKDIASAVMYASEGDTLNEVFKRIADASRELVHAKYAALGIPDGSGGLKHFAVSGMSEEEIREMDGYPRGKGLLGAIMNENKPVRLENLVHHERSAGFPPHHPHMTHFLGVPVRLGNRLFGMLYICDRIDGEPFSENDETLVEMMAGYAALAIVNSQARQQEKRLALLEERERISMELHDGVIQSLYAIGMQLELLRTAGRAPSDGEYKQVLYSLDHVIEDIRSYIQDLARRNFQQKTIHESLEEILSRLCIPHSLQVQIHAPHYPIPVSPIVYEAACQMTHEAVSNVLRHADAHSLEVSAGHRGSTLQISIVDDGHGFDLSQLKKRSGLGLRNMQQRAQLHGGTVEIDSEPGRGTAVIISLPLNGK